MRRSILHAGELFPPSSVTILLVVFAALAASCGKSWQVEYGEPEAQFLQADVVAKGKPYLGRKVTIKGTVERVDASDPKAAIVYLKGGVSCNLGRLSAMANACKPGETVYVDGILERCEKDAVILSPAVCRDPTAPFSPQ